ncbi:hypothetical protein [Halorhabdus rudnickae]|uniref:hypothetical protein n=1 Tax=Halorhabdus rudnickae TaxID=1775544 RepID=UPI00108377CF|nr:hypothetical protein [Halorhabdus rudnickae]
MSGSETGDNHEEVFTEIGRQLAEQLGESIDEEVSSAVEKLEDDDIVAFGLVAIRNGDEGIQSATQRVIDPEVVQESNKPPEEVIDVLHTKLCSVWETEVADR